VFKLDGTNKFILIGANNMKCIIIRLWFFHPYDCLEKILMDFCMKHTDYWYFL